MDRKTKTLLILTPAFPAHEADSNWLPAHQLFVRSLIQHFPGIRITVVTFLQPQDAGVYPWHGANVFSFPQRKKGKWQHLLLWRDIWQTLRRVRREYEIIGILSFWCGECALIGSYFGRLHAIRHRCWISGLDARKENKWVKYIRPKPNELVAMSAFLQKTFHTSHGIRPDHVIPNGIDKQLFTPAPGERDLDIFGAGSLIPLKQYELFVEVVALLRIHLPGLKAVHCGGGGEMENLQALIRRRGLERNISLLGEKPHSEILRRMQRTRVFLHPSAYEGYSTVCLEALYAGAHVISFCKPMEDAVAHWHIVKDVEEMAIKALTLLLNPETQYTPVLVDTMDNVAKKAMNLFE